jgi:hypothetical protein
MADQADRLAPVRWAGERLVMAMFEEVHFFGNADAGANRFVETLVDDNREAYRLNTVLDLDFDFDFQDLNDINGRIGRLTLNVLGIPGLVAVFHGTFLLAVASAPQMAAKAQFSFGNGQKRQIRTFLDYL